MTCRARALGLLVAVLAALSAGTHAAGPALDAGAEAEKALSRLSAEDRQSLLRRAQVWRRTDVARVDIMAGPRQPGAFAPGQEVDCDNVEVATPPSGTTPKFPCRVAPSDVVKVKFGRKNGEVFAEVAATRLFWALGFGADAVYPVQVRCHQCPVEPWFYRTKQKVDESVFEFATIERKFPGIPLESKEQKGWGWDELGVVDERAGGAPKAHRDALALLAVFVQHGDNKADQQRFVCLREGAKGRGGDAVCKKPFLYVQDLGATFGHAGELSLSKWDVEAWAKKSVWKDPARCVGDLDASRVGTLQDPLVSEAGRSFLGRLLSQLTDRQIVDLYRATRSDRRDGHGQEPAAAPSSGGASSDPASAWLEAFKRKRREIVEHRCPA